MLTVCPSPSLRFALLVDACASGATGLLQLGATQSLSALLAIPHAVLLGTGEFAVVYALLLVAMATRTRLWAAPVRVVVVGNGLWALASVGLLLSGALSPSPLGVGFVLLQAVAVLVFAAFEWRGLRLSPPAAARGHAAMS